MRVDDLAMQEKWLRDGLLTVYRLTPPAQTSILTV